MNYNRLHDSIINNARLNPSGGYTEEHHIIPRCMSGSDDPENKIILSARQHFVIHWLLTKIYPDQSGLIYAFHMMFHPTSAGTRKTNWIRSRSRVYARLKEKMVVDIKNRFAADGHPRTGTTHTPETIAKIKETKRLRPRVWTDEQRQAVVLQRTGAKQPDTQKRKVAEALSQTWHVTTPEGTTMTITNLRQFCLAHGLRQSNLSTYGHTKGYKATKVAL